MLIVGYQQCMSLYYRLPYMLTAQQHNTLTCVCTVCTLEPKEAHNKGTNNEHRSEHVQYMCVDYILKQKLCGETD